MKSQSVSLLLIEEDLEDLCLFNELIAEIQEEHLHRVRIPNCDLLHALNLEEATLILEQATVDLILLDAVMAGESVVEALCRLRAGYSEIPVIVLTNEHSIGDETQMIRLGAQDVLWKKDLDCVPLLRAVSFAIERHKSASALRSITYMDELTGLYNQPGFLELAHHALAMSRGQALPCSLLAIRPAAPPLDDDVDLMLIEIADLLRAAADPSQILARYDPDMFLVLIPAATERCGPRFIAQLNRGAQEVNQRRECGRPPLGLRFGLAHAASPPPLEEWIAAARDSLCENEKHAEPVRR